MVPPIDGQLVPPMNQAPGSITDTAAGPAAGAVAVLNHRVYDAYGQIVTQTAPAAATRFTYTGRVADPVTALTYHRARWSDPAAGRFVSEDPIRFAGGLSNLSDYVGASPYDRTDPSGRIFKWLREKVIKPIRNAISEAFDKVKEVVGKGLRKVAEFVTERPLVSLGIAALTGGIGSILSGSVGAFLGKAGALGSKVLGSVLPKFTAASSGLGGTASLSLGKLASVSAGAGVSGTSLFAGANVSVLGVPIVGIGKSVGVLGALADPVAGSVAGGLTDALSRGLLGSGGSIDVASFVPAVGRQGAINAGYSVLGQTGVPSLVGSLRAAAGTASDVFGAVREVFAPPPPVMQLAAAGTLPGTRRLAADGTIRQAGHVQTNPHAFPRRLPPVGMTPHDGPNPLRPYRLPPVHDDAYRSRYDWINGESFETIDLGIGSIADVDLGFMEGFWNNLSDGKVTRANPDPNSVGSALDRHVAETDWSYWDLFSSALSGELDHVDRWDTALDYSGRVSRGAGTIAGAGAATIATGGAAAPLLLGVGLYEGDIAQAEIRTLVTGQSTQTFGSRAISNYVEALGGNRDGLASGTLSFAYDNANLLHAATHLPQLIRSGGDLLTSLPQRLLQRGGAPKGARGPMSGRPFDVSHAGGPVQNLTTDRIRITDRGIDYLERHIARFGDDAANSAMVARLRRISNGDMKPSAQDLNFYSHELRESVRYRRLGHRTGAGDDYDLWNNAHTGTLEDYRLSDFDLEGNRTLYHPDVWDLFE